MPTPPVKQVGNRVVTIKVGDRIENASGRIEKLLPSDWDQCQFRWPNPILEWAKKHAIALNVEITGRSFQYRGQFARVKVRLEWVGDGEPSTFCEGWLLVDSVYDYPLLADLVA